MSNTESTWSCEVIIIFLNANLQTIRFEEVPLHRAPVWSVNHQPNNVLQRGERVFKLYDYRGSRGIIPREQRRRPDLYLLCVEATVLEVKAEDLVIISYPEFKGDHRMKTSAQAAALLRQLRDFHERGIVLGDIRLRNIVFDADGGCANFIDFDYSKLPDAKQVYPAGWNLAIDDGIRVDGAEEGCELLPEHDWGALANVFARFHSERRSKQKLWASVIAKMQVGELGAGLAILEGEKKSFALVPAAPTIPLWNHNVVLAV